jgi:hypothetical protein
MNFKIKIMKKYIFYNVFVLGIFLSYFLLSSHTDNTERKINPVPVKENKLQVSSPYPKEFINCILNMGYFGRWGWYNPQYSKSVEYQISRYLGELNFNSLHIYSGASIKNDGYSLGGSFNDNIENYREYFDSVRTTVYNARIKGIYGRAKIEMPCYFQRVEYEVKEQGINPSLVNYGFCYQTNNGEFEDDNGRTVIHAEVGTTPPCDYICKDIFENHQHSDFFDWGWNDGIEWRLRPMLRIDSNYVDQHPDEKVLRIDIIKYNGNVLDSIIIKAKNFSKRLDNGTYLYAGNYIDSMIFYDNTKLKFNGDNDETGLNEGRHNSPNLWNANNHVDFRVFWYGNTDVWFDKLTVEDKFAEKLFAGEYDDKIIGTDGEASNFTDYKLFSFFADEVTYSCFKSIKYVRDKLNSVNAKFYFAVTNYFSTIGMRNDTLYYQAMVDIINPECFCMDAHEVNGKVPQVYNEITSMNVPGVWKSSNYDDYNLFIQNRLLGDRNSICPTNTWPINYHLPSGTGSLIYHICLARRYANKCSPKSYLFIQPQIQSNMVKYTTDVYDWNREPTNEEISVQANVALAHGADGLSWFLYQSLSYPYNTTSSDISYSIKNHDGPSYPVDSLINVGMLKLNSDERRSLNYYDQNKWEFVGNMNKVFMNWKPTLDAINWVEGFSTHTEGTNHNFVSDIKSIHRNPSNIFSDDEYCTNCDYTKYWEMAFFNPILESDQSKYLLMVNRRCAPEITEGSGDLRNLYIKFNPAQFSGGNSWSIKDVNTGESISFDKNSTTFTYLGNLGMFQPGEGKLYKLTPNTISGGTLACDEIINGGTINLQDTLFTNGHNLTIGFGTTINFSDSACIVVNGGRFICGDVNQPNHERNIIFKGNNSNWSGLNFNGCELVNINSAQFQNLKGNSQDNNYTVKLINCNTFNINNCTFTNSESQNAGAIEANFTNSTPAQMNTYIGSNTFDMNTSDKPVVNIIANADCNVPVIIDNNYFTSSSNSATAIYLSFVSGTEISGNSITGYNKGIEMHYTSVDVIGNTFYSEAGNNSARGIDAQDFSTANLTVNGTLQTGGLNTFDNSGENDNNIYIYNSYFLLNKGRNSFNILPNTNSFHLKGYFPGNEGDNTYSETSNCFKLDNTAIVETNLPIKDVKWMDDQETDLSFNFFSYDCTQGNEDNSLIVDYGNGVLDSIGTVPGGSGGGVPSVQTVTPKKMYDSLCINLRLKNYTIAKSGCYALLNSFPDSVQSLNAITKLYQLAVTLDTTTASATDCKNYLNTLILNRPNNLPLVRKSNYYIQKCKVRLRQYQSAMTGFQQIMQQNPYSYEALLASWDYASTHLLDSLHGTGGGLSNDQLQMYNVQSEEQNVDEFFIPEGSNRESFLNEYLEEMDKILFSDDDKDKFSKEERKTISSSVVTALDDSKKKSKNHIETLKKLSEKGNSDAKVELKVMNTIKETVKIKRPKTVIELIKSVNKDIQKLNTVKNETVKKVTSILPVSYNLSQNYPNPFNPVTKINYELPKDSKVKLVIYDILGREIKTLVNELKQAGRYTIEFNGTQYASGVYFYRIQVEEGNAYTSVKKMVLIK